MNSEVFEELLATLAHELRTPLSAVIGYARLLKSGKLDAAASEKAIECLYRNAERQAELVSHLLDASRIVRGSVELKMAPVDLAAIVEDVVDCVRIEAEAKSIRLIYKDEELSGSVFGDRVRLRQIVCNLLTNAIKFTPAGGRIHVHIRSSQGYASVSVTDNGEGLSPEFLPHVFEKFRQADTAASRHGCGLGLGLAIVRQLVNLHGGKVEASSRGIGKGATFMVKLPLQTMVLRKAS
jgi:signal transduction histidine kinase